MILVWLALSLHSFSLIPLLLEDGLYTSKPLYHNKRCYLTHTPLFTSKKITFYVVFLGAGAIYHNGTEEEENSDAYNEWQANQKTDKWASQASGESSDADEILTRPATPNTTLEQRMSLIRDTIGDQDLQISDDPNVVISLRQAKSTIQAASPLCCLCMARLEFSFYKTPHGTSLNIKCMAGSSYTQDEYKNEEKEENSFSENPQW